jgi:hypothetical protein
MDCEWPVSYAACGDVTLPDDIETFEDMATEMLWRWTGRKFGECPVTFRPCRQGCQPSMNSRPPLPFYGSSGSWPVGLFACGSCRGDGCGCTSGSVLRLDKRATSIDEIIIDGAVLDPATYRLDDGWLLRRQDGGAWPYCQDLSLPAGEIGTWTISATYGEPVPMGGQIAAGKFALELQKAACGATGCELPKRWQTISRQGVTIAAQIDTFEDIEKGRTGIWLIDAWVASITKSNIGFSVASPDLRGVGRTSWT